jgi:hypothetical protein
VPTGSGIDLQGSETNTLVFALGGLFRYDLNTGTLRTMYPTTRPDYLALSGQYAYLGNSSDEDILAVPLHKDPRPVETISGQEAAAGQEASDIVFADSMVYAVAFSTNGDGRHTIARMQPDGAGYQELFATTDQLGNVAVYNGRVYFLCGACGNSGPSLVSIPEGGGSARLESLVGYNPTLTQIGNVLFILDQPNGGVMNISAFNLDLGTKQFVTEAPFSTSIQGLVGDAQQVFLALYYGPRAYVARYPRTGWGTFGPAEVIVDSSSNTLGFSAGTLTLIGQRVFYWFQGLIAATQQ